jgi:hypothetical protein
MATAKATDPCADVHALVDTIHAEDIGTAGGGTDQF